MFNLFKKNTDGNVAMMFAITSTALVIGIGAAVDYGSASSHKQSLQDMVDAATLAAAKANSTDLDELQKIAATVILEHDAANQNIALDVKVIDGEVHITGKTKYDTHIMSFAGKPYIDVVASAASPIAALTPVKIALVLDTTGSMAGADIDALKLASAGFIDELDETDSNAAVSVVPFGQYVNVGTSRKSASWLDVKKDGTSATEEVCWEETRELSPYVCTETGRTLTRDNYSDGRYLGETQYQETSCTGGETEPTGNTICEMQTTTYTWNGCVGSRQSPYNVRAEFGGNRIEGIMNHSCGAELQELTKSFSEVKSAIGDLTASGSTYLPSGLIWGWRTLQDKAPLKTKVKFKKAKKVSTDASKYMIFMTDGANTVSQGGSEPHRHEAGDGAEADKRTRELCDSIKKDGVQIYTIGYRMAEATGDAETVLKDCATSSAHYYDAANAAQLKKVFKDLAGQLDGARLSM